MEFQSGRPYTINSNNIIDDKIDSILNSITNILVKKVNPLAVILHGSFARGEGTVFMDEDEINIVSDFEISIVDNNIFKRKKLTYLRNELEKKFNIELTLGFLLTRRFYKQISSNWSIFENRNHPIEQYELLNGFKYLYLNGKALRTINISPSNIPLWEGIRLLFNRMAELIIAIISGKEKEMTKACFKSLIACGDNILLMKKKYHYSYNKRLRNLELITFNKNELIPFNKEEFKFISNSYKYKLGLLNIRKIALPCDIHKTINIFEKMFRFVINREMNINIDDYKKFSHCYINSNKVKEYSRMSPFFDNLRILCKHKKNIGFKNFINIFKPISIHNYIYAELPNILFNEIQNEFKLKGNINFDLKSISIKTIYNWKNFCN